jgi:cytochrome c-type biogenesis protein CcmH
VGRWRTVAIALALIVVSPALAVQPDEILKDPALEVRARALSRELRCMVCQNQSIDDSDAPLARDLRILVRERITAGDSDAKVIDFLTARYGEFVLLKPRLSAATALLWAAPAAVLIVGGCVLVVALRRRRAVSESADAPDAKLSPDEQARLARLLKPAKD